MMKRQDNTCVYCGHRRTASSLEIDHMTPVVRGGSNDVSNLQVICRPCNQRKGLQTDLEFRTRYRRLVGTTPLTPPGRRISQREYREETQRTEQGDSVRQFRRTRFISRRQKISSGCLVLGVAVGLIVVFALAAVDVGADVSIWPALVLGGAAGLGVWLRARKTGAMLEDDE